MNRHETTASTSAAVANNIYFPFIDGLRGVSILCVVLYHVGFSFAPGGFVGVDVFFVISGFLIINHIVEGCRSGAFSFVEFYSRRALRILPPYLLVIVASALIARWVLVFPEEHEQFGREAAYSAILAVNFLFLGQEGYFDVARDTKILLHLWSLAVEEQFYLAAPAVVFLIWKMKKAKLATASLLFAASLIGCIVLTGDPGDRNYAFYLAPLRAWEFMVGGFAAVVFPYLSRAPRMLAEGLGIAGLASIIAAATLLDSTMPFPSYFAVLPAFGALAIIASGLAHSKGAIVSILALRPLVFIGLISYAWYLWHWPLLTFARIYAFGERHLPTSIAMAIIALILAVLTRFGLEAPILKWRKRHGEAAVARKVVIAGVAICIGAATVFSFPYKRAVTPAFAKNERAEPSCAVQNGRPESCSIAGRVSGLLIGDSQAASAAGRLQRHLAQNGATLFTMTSGGCIPIWTAKVFIPYAGMSQRCVEGKETALRLMSDKAVSPSFVIMFARWPLYTHTLRAYALGSPDDDVPPRNQQSIFISELRNTVSTFKDLGVERVLVIGAAPEFPRHVPRCAARSSYYDADIREECSTTREAVLARRERVTSWIEEALSDLPDVRFADPLDIFCGDIICGAFDNDRTLFLDTNHLSDAGMEQLIGGIRPDLRWATGL